jgi:hypothetical protein
MIWVIEYGKDIGTLKNLFDDLGEAMRFAMRIIEQSHDRYQHIGPNQWFCRDKNEYIKIVNA